MSGNWKQWQRQAVGDDFQLTEHLGGSASSATYLAAAPDNAKVAIKLVAANPATDETHLAQWRIAESLSHPHLLRVFRSGRCELEGNSLLYVVMEYAEENLSQILPQRSLTVDEVREMLPPVLDALDYLHGNELVHGNLKPGNIMAAGDLLKLSSDALMRDGEIGKWVGGYCAPEVAQGISPASDLWSLGVTLVEVLTQRLPVWDTGAALPQLPDNLPEQFRVIVQHCLVGDPNLRAKTADIRERLKAVQTRAAAPKQAEVAPAGAGRSSKRFVIPVAIGVLAIIGAIIAIPRLSEHRQEIEKPAVVAMPTPEAQTPAPTPPPAVMAEATEPPPVPHKAEPQKSEPIQLLVPEKPADKPSAQTALPKRVVATPVKAEVPVAMPVSKQDGVINQVLPDIPRKAINTINGKVRVQVKVKVDRTGSVVDSEFVSPGPSKYFANLTMQAARDWKFSPSDAEMRAWNLQFEFRRSGASVVPTQIAR
jgi:outer membrane biosynthesis protein TonB